MTESESEFIAKENAALLANLWNGIELEVKAKSVSRIAKILIQTHYRENSCPATEGFIESEARSLGFSIAESRDKTAYIFRRQNLQFLNVCRDDLENECRSRGASAILPAEVICASCFYRFDEHPVLGSVEITTGSRYLRLIARATCSSKVLFEKAVEI